MRAQSPLVATICRAVVAAAAIGLLCYVGSATVPLHAGRTALGGGAGPAAATRGPVDPAFFQGLGYRMVGPLRGGRVTAVAGHRRQPLTFYMGATGGGVWKTTDYGQTWVNISDGFFATGSIGAIDVAESDPNIVYVGTGSAAIRSNVIRGRGVYRSADAGRTWSFVGLRDVGQIGSLRIHPQDPGTVYVAALGQPFGPNPERGVFRTRDGGQTWQKVLFINDRTGAVSLSINPANPLEIYAGAWRGERRPWTIISGGPAAECGLYKTADGGDTWTHLTAGLPGDLVGKIDVDVSRANPRRVYVILEAPGQEGGVYRSDDGGATFVQTSSQASLVARTFYYTYIDADPKDENTVWVNNLSLWKSTDAGRTWRSVPTPHGDNHGMWINPDNPDIMIQSNDGGANVSLNGGRSWSTQYNQPTAEIYGVEVDNQFPYRLYGAQQDTGSPLIVPSLPPAAGTPDQPMQLEVPGPGCETGPVKPRPDDPTVVYGACKGEFSRMNMKVGQEQARWVHPQNRYGHAARDIRYRFQRVSPFEISPHDPRIIYMGSQFLHRTNDEGVTWEIVSPDLTAGEPDKQGVSGEPITRDITGEEIYSTIYAIRESPLERGVVWVGANDGPVHVTRDAGKTWKKVTPPDVPPGGRVQDIEVSPHRRGSAYVAIYRYLLNDWQPYICRTDDYGATWTRLTDGRNGIPADFPTRVVREDPDREGLLYAGTEFGIFISFDNGARWQSFQLNLPVTPVTDIRLHRRDLVLSTMGRSFWILDDLAPLHQIDDAVKAGRPYLFAPRDAYLIRNPAMGGRPDQPQYPAPGALIDYFLPAVLAGPVTLDILDAGGKVLRSFSSEGPDMGTSQTRDPDQPRIERGGMTRAPKRAGANRFAWDLRHPAQTDPGSMRGGGGPRVVPGKYQVRLTVGEVAETRPLEVRIDPRVATDGVTQADLEEQLALCLRIRGLANEARQTAIRIAQAREAARVNGASAAATVQKLTALEAALVTASGPYPQPMLIDQLANLYRMASAADQKVGRSTFQYLDELKGELARIQTELDALKSR
jgi:photosystem II stability/assembly factor-like uncharacterized protein